MALQAHQHLWAPSPTAHHPGQRRQQQVVDLCAIGYRGLLKQLPGGLTVQLRADRRGMLEQVFALRIITRQRVIGALQLRLPEAKLSLQPRACGMTLQVLGPGLERAGLGRQLRRRPGA
ncbi:hypothetical protein D3C80_1829430 [compost metagenome]